MIPIADPKLGDKELDRVRSVLESGMLADGPEVRSFEDEFASYCGTEYAVATSNGTTALHASMEGLGLGSGDNVLTTPFSFVASANAIRLCGAEPVFADIDPRTYALDPDATREVLEERDDIDAIVVVHLYGLAADMDAFCSIADEYDLLLIEDAAQAHGAEYDGTRVGSFGDAACFSFYPTKNMTTGEGGMITTDREEVADAAARFVNHGRTDGYEHVELGHNFRMTSLAAAIGRAQLERLPELTEQRRSNAGRLSNGLQETPLTLPHEPKDRRHVYHQYTVRADDRDKLRRHLEESGVGTGIYYPKCIHEQEAYADVEYTAPMAEAAAEEVLSLPVHSNVSELNIETITTAVRKFYANE
ncbi:aminotransferase class I/II-fold pyridoxal phosphate-dependent enzyme [Halobellus sp. GM3]|uniref:aminotransferase class I/II-fold pyridoxal phosphate-dependent enzyme n=1 Tax=Halobellus sp. GM3 TaxID=3458410 RepID=UPI00403E0FAA